MGDSENEVRDFIRRKSASDDQQEWAMRRLEAALVAARAEGRKEGFDKAREMAAEKAKDEATECARLARNAQDNGMAGARQCWQAAQTASDAIERRIRAMRDGAGAEQP